MPEKPSSKKRGETVMRYIRVLSETAAQIKYSDQKRVLLEIALIKLNTPAMENDYESYMHDRSVLKLIPLSFDA